MDHEITFLRDDGSTVYVSAMYGAFTAYNVPVELTPAEWRRATAQLADEFDPDVGDAMRDFRLDREFA